MMSVVTMPKAGDIVVTMFFCFAVVIGEMSVLESGFLALSRIRSASVQSCGVHNQPDALSEHGQGDK